MKNFFLFFALFLSLTLFAQKKEYPIDSAAHYRAELGKLWRETYDSLRNAERYKTLVANLDRLRSKSRSYAALVLFIDFLHSNYDKFNTSIAQDGFSSLPSIC